MNFGILDNSCMFVPVFRQENNEQQSHGLFLWTFVSYYLTDIRLSLPVGLWRNVIVVSCRKLGGGSLSLFKNFKIHSTMARNNESEVQVQSVPTSQPKSQSKLEKEIATIQKKVAVLQAECKMHEAEKYRLLRYIDRYCSCLLSNFLENNPLNSRDWKKLHKQQLDIREAIK